MRTEEEKELHLIDAADDQDLDARDPQRSSKAGAAALKAGLVGSGLVLLSLLFLPRQDVVPLILYAAVGVVAARLLPSPSTIVRSVKAGAIAGLIAAGIAFGVWFVLLVTVARPFLEPIAGKLFGTAGWSGFLSWFAWNAAWNILAAVALGALGSGLAGGLRLRRRRSR